jgi:hypothetical protein
MLGDADAHGVLSTLIAGKRVWSEVAVQSGTSVAAAGLPSPTSVSAAHAAGGMNAGLTGPAAAAGVSDGALAAAQRSLPEQWSWLGFTLRCLSAEPWFRDVACSRWDATGLPPQSVAVRLQNLGSSRDLGAAESGQRAAGAAGGADLGAGAGAGASEPSKRSHLVGGKAIPSKPVGTSLPSASDGAAAAPAQAPTVALPEPFPTSIGGFSKSLHYVLQRTLHADEALDLASPAGQPLGLFKGQHIYSRAAVVPCLPAEAWFRRHARVLCPGEEARPLRYRPLPKQQKEQALSSTGLAIAGGSGVLSFLGSDDGTARGSSSSSSFSTEAGAGAGAGSGSCEGTPLYGQWQTQPYAPPPHAAGAPIPTSERGVFELWGRNTALLPAGLVHIPASAAAELPGATVKGVAWKAGIPCVEAMVGFETKRGRPIPTYDGVVVAAADAPRVLQALAVREQADILSSIQERRGEVQERWALLVRKALVRSRIGGVYASNGLMLPSRASGTAASSARSGDGARGIGGEAASASSVPLTSLVLAGEAEALTLESLAAASKGRQRGTQAAGAAGFEATGGRGSTVDPRTAAATGRDRTLDIAAATDDGAVHARHPALPTAVRAVGGDLPSSLAAGGGVAADEAGVEGEGFCAAAPAAAAGATAQPEVTGTAGTGSSRRYAFGADDDD